MAARIFRRETPRTSPELRRNAHRYACCRVTERRRSIGLRPTMEVVWLKGIAEETGREEAAARARRAAVARAPECPADVPAGAAAAGAVRAADARAAAGDPAPGPEAEAAAVA